MPHSAKLSLIVPGLVWQKQALEDLSHDLATPALSSMLGKGRVEKIGPVSETRLASAFGMISASPAPLRLLGLGGEPGNARWICLDPIHLAFVERNLHIGDPQHLNLSDDEACQLAVALAPTFSSFGEILVSTPGQWHLRLHPATAPLPPMAALPDLIGGRADEGLRLDAEWRRLLNEAQMLLHAHPVNLTREAKGKPAVNSLWPWGHGTLPVRGTPTHDIVISSDPVLRGLAKLCGIPSANPTEAWTHGGHRAPLIGLDALAASFRCGDGLAWRETLIALEANWFAPILRALRSGHLRHLSLFAPGDPASFQLELSRPALLAFWRNDKPLACLGA